MPAYDYLCEACACQFERRQKMSEPAVKTCPECGGSVKRLISGGAGAITKGDGSHSGGHPEANSGCGFGGPCCGQGGACNNKQFCEH
jgi:putative FmdB family regulatory protein